MDKPLSLSDENTITKQGVVEIVAVVWWHVVSMDFLAQECVLVQLMTICVTMYLVIVNQHMHLKTVIVKMNNIP
jgi:hypothetical protein